MNDILKVILTITILLFIIQCKPTKTKAPVPEDAVTIDFTWESDTLGTQFKEKIGISVPFSLDGIPQKFYSQFDLGSVETMVYGNSMKLYLEENPVLKEKLVEIEGGMEFLNVGFSVGGLKMENADLFYFEDHGDEYTQAEIEEIAPRKIGTVGADIFQNKYLIIDFPNQQLLVYTSLPERSKEFYEFVDIIIEKGRIKVPVSIDGEIEYFMFDTGSSLFTLVSAKQGWERIVDSSSATDTLNVSSWGEYYDVYGKTISSTVAIGGLTMNTKDKLAYLHPKVEYEQFFQQENITGLMGNSFFLEKIIVIDFINKRLGVEK